MPASSNFQRLLHSIDPPAVHQYLDVGGIRTSYLEAGEGPTLILLHGAGGGAINWYKVIGPLSRQFRVIAFDKPGYGESDKPWADYSRTFYLDWLQAAVQALGIDRFDLLGNSQGGAIAVAYAMRYPGQLRKLILVSPGGMSDEWDRTIIPQMILYRLFPVPLWEQLMGSKVFKDASVADPAWHQYAAEVIRKPGGRYPFFLGRGKAVKTFTAEELRSVQVPTLIIWGKDEAFFPISHGERARSLIPKAELSILPNAGHFPWMEEPERFIELVSGFLQ